ncbi:MAG: fatty acid desaturase, partial [Pseudomonadota bacterium]|nr:fatty acid desaturase [Pseudomonadota bacterium]
MDSVITLDRRDTPARPDAARLSLREPILDDKAMLRTAADLTRDLNAPRPAIYWSDLIASVAMGYGALALAMTLGSAG